MCIYTHIYEYKYPGNSNCDIFDNLIACSVDMEKVITDDKKYL